MPHVIVFTVIMIVIVVILIMIMIFGHIHIQVVNLVTVMNAYQEAQQTQVVEQKEDRMSSGRTHHQYICMRRNYQDSVPGIKYSFQLVFHRSKNILT